MRGLNYRCRPRGSCPCIRRAPRGQGIASCRRKIAKKYKRQQKYGITGMRLNNPPTIKELSLVKTIIQQSLAYFQQNIEAIFSAPQHLTMEQLEKAITEPLKNCVCQIMSRYAQQLDQQIHQNKPPERHASNTPYPAERTARPRTSV